MGWMILEVYSNLRSSVIQVTAQNEALMFTSCLSCCLTKGEYYTSCLGVCCQLATSLTFLLPFEQCAALEAHTTVFLPLSKALKSHRNIFWSRFLGSLYIKDFSSWCSDVLLILCRNFLKLVGNSISFQQLFEVFHCDS